ncbi:MAG: hypothetical protein PHP83_01485 [Clostridia bacterium]|nr:hypothetical protein [Clostridia bacterium]
MKKKIFTLILLALITVAFGCKANNLMLQKHLIERRDNLFLYNDSTYCASFYTGEREEPYELDGEVNELVEFGIIIFYAHNQYKLSAESYPFELHVNDEIFTGNLERNDSDKTYSIDIEKTAPADAVVTLKVALPSANFEQTLVNVSKDFVITQNQAIKIAGEELSSVLKDILKSNKNVEVIVKMLKDFSDSESTKYYWYVGIVSSDGTTAGILIDTQTGEIISKKL